MIAVMRAPTATTLAIDSRNGHSVVRIIHHACNGGIGGILRCSNFVGDIERVVDIVRRVDGIVDPIVLPAGVHSRLNVTASASANFEGDWNKLRKIEL